jgi:hypothetical protein
MSDMRAAKVVPDTCRPRTVGDVVGFARLDLTTDYGPLTAKPEFLRPLRHQRHAPPVRPRRSADVTHDVRRVHPIDRRWFTISSASRRSRYDAQYDFSSMISEPSRTLIWRSKMAFATFAKASKMARRWRRWQPVRDCHVRRGRHGGCGSLIGVLGFSWSESTAKLITQFPSLPRLNRTCRLHR